MWIEMKMQTKWDRKCTKKMQEMNAKQNAKWVSIQTVKTQWNAVKTNAGKQWTETMWGKNPNDAGSVKCKPKEAKRAKWGKRVAKTAERKRRKRSPSREKHVLDQRGENNKCRNKREMTRDEVCIKWKCACEMRKWSKMFQTKMSQENWRNENETDMNQENDDLMKWTQMQEPQIVDKIKCVPVKKM